MISNICPFFKKETKKTRLNSNLDFYFVAYFVAEFSR